MAEESSSSILKRKEYSPIMDYLSKNILQILSLIVMLALTYSTLNNDVSNINKNLVELSITVKEMGATVKRLEGEQPKIDYLEKQLEELKLRVGNGIEMMNAIDNVYAQKVAKLEAENVSLHREIDRLERKID